MNDYSEDTLVERPAIAVFAELGWKTANLFNERFGPEGVMYLPEGARFSHLLALPEGADQGLALNSLLRNKNETGSETSRGYASVTTPSACMYPHTAAVAALHRWLAAVNTCNCSSAAATARSGWPCPTSSSTARMASNAYPEFRKSIYACVLTSGYCAPAARAGAER